MKNLILNTDSYKTSHYVQYPQGTEFVSSYIESRGGVLCKYDCIWPSGIHKSLSKQACNERRYRRGRDSSYSARRSF